MTVDLADALEQACAGDEAAFRQLWRAFQPKLLRYLAIRAPGAAEDLASEVWLRAVQHLPGFQGDEEDFRGWLFTIAHNQAVDLARSRSRRPAAVVPVDELYDLAGPDDPERQALGRLGLRDAIDLVRQLPPDQADAVALRVLADLDVAECAALLGKSPGNVRVAVHRGLRALVRRGAAL